MLLLKFYYLAFREAFRHSLDITQAIIFVALAVGGLIAARNRTVKPIIDSLDLGGYQIAAIAFGSIIAIRLVLAPYWLWRLPFPLAPPAKNGIRIVAFAGAAASAWPSARMRHQ